MTASAVVGVPLPLPTGKQLHKLLDDTSDLRALVGTAVSEEVTKQAQAALGTESTAGILSASLSEFDAVKKVRRLVTGRVKVWVTAPQRS